MNFLWFPIKNIDQGRFLNIHGWAEAKAEIPADEAEELEEEHEAALKNTHIMSLSAPSAEVKALFWNGRLKCADLLKRCVEISMPRHAVYEIIS